MRSVTVNFIFTDERMKEFLDFLSNSPFFLSVLPDSAALSKILDKSVPFRNLCSFSDQ